VGARGEFFVAQGGVRAPGTRRRRVRRRQRTFETVTTGQLTMMLSSSWHAALTMLTGCDAHPPTGCCAAPHSA